MGVGRQASHSCGDWIFSSHLTVILTGECAVVCGVEARGVGSRQYTAPTLIWQVNELIHVSLRVCVQLGRVCAARALDS